MKEKEFLELLNLCQSCEDQDYINSATRKVAESGNPYFICDFAENVKLADTKENIKILEDAIINTLDLVHIYEFMFLLVDSEVKNFNLKRFEEIIRNSHNPKIMCYCIGFVPGIDFDLMLEALYKTKNAKYIERLSDEEFGLDTNELPMYEKRLEEAKNYDYFPSECFGQFKTRNINSLIKFVINSKNPYLINELADYIEYLSEYKNIHTYDIKSLQRAQLECADPLHLYEFAASIKDADKIAFQNKVIDSGMAKYMYYMSEYVSGVDTDELQTAIKGTGNTKYIKKNNSKNM